MAPSRVLRLAVPPLALVIALALSAGSSAKVQSGARAESCSPYVIVDSRGSAEPQNTLSPPGAAFVREFRRLHGLYVGAARNVYPAAGGWVILAGGELRLPAGYHQSVVTGKRELRKELSTVARCGSQTQIVLTGYSQGAQVAADVAQEHPDPQILGVVLFGDPYFNGRDDTADRGSYTHGHNGALGIRPLFTGRLRGRVLSYCHDHDPVCQSTLSPYSLLRFRLTRHDNYAKLGEPERAAALIAALEGPTLAGLDQVKPAHVGLSGDGTLILAGPSAVNSPIEWKTWGQHAATGRAGYWTNDCNPNCAEGTYTSGAPFDIEAFRRVSGHFTRMNLMFPTGTVTYRWWGAPEFFWSAA